MTSSGFLQCQLSSMTEPQQKLPPWNWLPHANATPLQLQVLKRRGPTLSIFCKTGPAGVSKPTAKNTKELSSQQTTTPPVPATSGPTTTVVSTTVPTALDLKKDEIVLTPYGEGKIELVRSSDNVAVVKLDFGTAFLQLNQLTLKKAKVIPEVVVVVANTSPSTAAVFPVGSSVQTPYGVGVLTSIRSSDGMAVVALDFGAKAYLQVQQLGRVNVSALVGQAVTTVYGDGTLQEIRKEDECAVVLFTLGTKGFLRVDQIRPLRAKPFVPASYWTSGIFRENNNDKVVESESKKRVQEEALVAEAQEVAKPAAKEEEKSEETAVEASSSKKKKKKAKA